MSGRARKGSNGTSQRVTAEMIQRLRDVQVLWLAVMNDPRPVADLAPEFYFKVGELMEGKRLADLTYHAISRDRVLSHAKDT